MIEIKSFAKVNLTLEVGQLESSGYHKIQSIVQTVSLFDRILIEINKSKDIVINTDKHFIPCDDKNTVYNIARLFLDKYAKDYGVNIFIYKNIPVQGGLGGGSSNASSVLIALNKIFNAGMSLREMADMSGLLGSDMPLFIYGGRLYITGRGDIIKPLPDADKFYFNILKPKGGVSTGVAYKRLDSRENIDFKGYSESMISSGNLLDFMVNDFEAVSCEINSNIKPAKDLLLKSGALCAMLSGSGSSVFAVYENRELRDKAFELLKGLNVFACESIGRDDYYKEIMGDLFNKKQPMLFLD